MALRIYKAYEYTIYCENSGCDAGDFIQSVDGAYKVNDTPSRYFKRLGWRERNGKTLCPKCVRSLRI